MAWRKSSSYTGESFLKLLEMQKYNWDVFQVHLEKWSTSCHISKQGCHSHQQCWPSKCKFLALRTTRKENNTCDQATIRLQSFPTVRTEEFRMWKITGCWHQITEIHMKGMISVSPDYYIFPYMKVKMNIALLCPTLCDPEQNNGVGSHSLLQGIFPIQGSNPGLPHCSRFFTLWATREAQEYWSP